MSTPNDFIDIDAATPLLAGLSPRQFMRRYWQKKPLLIRQAWPRAQEIFREKHSRIANMLDGAEPSASQSGWIVLSLPAGRAFLQKSLEAAAQKDIVETVISPFDAAGAAQVSKDKHTAYISVGLKGPTTDYQNEEIEQLVGRFGTRRSAVQARHVLDVLVDGEVVVQRRLIGDVRQRSTGVERTRRLALDEHVEDAGTLAYLQDTAIQAGLQTTLMDIGAIRFELKQLLGMDVDVLTPNSLPASFREQVLREALAL